MKKTLLILAAFLLGRGASGAAETGDLMADPPPSFSAEEMASMLKRGTAGAGVITATEEENKLLTDIWWMPLTNAVALNGAFEQVYGLGGGGTVRHFAHVLETELGRPGGGDSNTVSLALNVLAWSGDLGVTGVLRRALFDSRNPYRAQTFFACVVASRVDQEPLAQEVIRRTAPEERLDWYRKASRVCPMAVRVYLPSPIQGYDPGYMENPCVRTDKRGSLLRANYRLQFYFYTASPYETDARCAYFMERGENYWKGRLGGDGGRWLDGVSKRLAERFKDTPGEIGEYFTGRIKKIGDGDELRYCDIGRWHEQKSEDPDRQKLIETAWRLSFNLSENELAPAYKQALKKMFDADSPFFGSDEDRTEPVYDMIEMMEEIGIPPAEIKAVFDSVSDTCGVVYPPPEPKAEAGK
jgi:hypothetical protein